MKVSELGNEKDGYALLDYWVAKAEGNEWHKDENGNHIINGHYFFPEDYSTDWSQGGPIIERENIDLYVDENFGPSAIAHNISDKVKNDIEDGRTAIIMRGDTKLIAAMRAYISSKYGEEVND